MGWQRTDYVYDDADRLQFYVKPDGSVVAYDWDGNGNMVARTEGSQTTQFEYDYDNRLVKIVYPNGSTVQFGYDGLGRRVFKQEGSFVRYFYFDGDRMDLTVSSPFYDFRTFAVETPNTFIPRTFVNLCEAVQENH